MSQGASNLQPKVAGVRIDEARRYTAIAPVPMYEVQKRLVYLCLARKVFGREYIDVVSQRVRKVLVEWGYRIGSQSAILKTLYEALLYVRSPHLHQLTVDQLQAVVERHPPRTGSYRKVALSRVLASMGIIPEALKIERPPRTKQRSPFLIIGVPPSGRGSVVSGTSVPPLYRPTETKATISCSTLAVGSPTYILKWPLRPTGRAIWPGMPYRSSASGMEETGAVPTPDM